MEKLGAEMTAEHAATQTASHRFESMVALCPDNASSVVDAVRGAGFQAVGVQID